MKFNKSFSDGNIILLVLILCSLVANSFAAGLKGSIQGQVVDADNQQPLIGANVSIVGTQLGSATDTNGKFVIKNVPVGSYILQFNYIGYEPFRKTDIIVRSERITQLTAELKVSILEAEAINVTAGYFTETADQPTSFINFSAEEIRRAPGSAGDVSRILMSLPSVAKVNDQSNSLIVRGGSPVENAFYIDNVEIPNINHFPTQGASGGPIGMINVDFIQDVNFYAGGFSAMYGDKLSSIMEMNFREGNREEFDGQLDLNFTGFGGTFEGPLAGEKGSYLLSIRRSYLDLIIKAIDAGTTVAPRYGDTQGKLVWDVNPNHKLELLGVFGDDHNKPDKAAALDNAMVAYGSQNIYENTVGVNWRALWNKKLYSNTSLAATINHFNEDFFETASDIHLLQNRSREHEFKFRNMNHLQLNSKNTLQYGIEAKYYQINYNNFVSQYTDALGDTVPYFDYNTSVNAAKAGAFVNLITRPVQPLTVTLGARGDYFSYNKKTTVSPRAAVSLRLDNRTSLNASAGVFYQSLPFTLLAQNDANKELADTRAVHYVAGIERLLTENTRLTLEVYKKEYSRFPIDPTQPSLFLIDEIYYRYGFFFNHANLVDNGKAESKGIELTLQKKLAEKVYGLVSAAYFTSRYQGGDGVWRDRVFDNRYVFSMEGGYKPNNKWEFSCRWIIAGGTPYTPLDLAASRALDREVLDENRLNGARYPDYHSLNLRFDRRFHYSNSNLVFYFSVWNLYNRQNVAGYYWNITENKQDTSTQWGMMPIFGLEYEF